MFSVITDSTAYLKRAEAERLGVRVLPMSYTAGGRPFGEGYLDESGRYRELIAQNLRDVHTSQVSTSAVLGAFNEMLRGGEDILCLTISSRLSGTYGNALMAAREMRTEKIMVVDSLSTAAGMRFLVERACELAREGRTLLEAANCLEKLRDSIGMALSVDDMEALRRSGRLGFVRQSVGTILNIRPILFCTNGTVVSGGTTRGLSGQIAELVRAIPTDAKRVEVQYIEPRPAVEALESAVKAKFHCPVQTSAVGPVLAIHLGLSAIGVAWMV